MKKYSTNNFSFDFNENKVAYQPQVSATEFLNNKSPRSLCLVYV